ncbi:DNA replication and repair protein RecO [Fusobacterium naviforme]|uniref:DNA repair protein RecO n=1 Tax=Moryella indoligenes TaxID=371674 RepID=A0AAE3V8C3_9FIRM|nr:DNA repair protein RecO [Moryella indoligenes]KAB0576969.1 DNA repair protein RecO [Fusobacterium naviforme]MDQ0151470.1 DNA repair protein RecO (recombination protein O) [Moryella indoligenes]PSL09322.1 DNA replication and repair protein RecO [Fusobacterium naviforme]STO27959.1 Recombination protein O [Fusobacterium naviforme]
MRNGVIEVTGMVLSVMPVGERDRRVALLTLEQGKLSFFARGAGRPGSPFMGVTRPFAYGKFSLFQGRDSYTLEGAEIANYFESLTLDVESTCYGTYFLELMDYYNREYAPEPRYLKLLYFSLLALQKPALPRELTRRIFELRSMVTDGSYDPEPPLRSGEGCAYTWHYICTAPLEKLYTFAISEESLAELGENVDASLHRYVDRTLHSLEILKLL